METTGNTFEERMKAKGVDLAKARAAMHRMLYNQRQEQGHRHSMAMHDDDESVVLPTGTLSGFDRLIAQEKGLHINGDHT